MGAQPVWCYGPWRRAREGRRPEHYADTGNGTRILESGSSEPLGVTRTKRKKVMIKVGINGFGRIGRMVFRAAVQRGDVEVVAINDLLDVDYLAYMLKYDSVHGRFKGSVDVKDGALIVNGKTIRCTSETDPSKLNWGAVAADNVI